MGQSAEPTERRTRLAWYQATAIFSVLFALLGFSYNVWRLEQTEQNSNRREAAFETLLQLAELEQLVYAAYYDQNPEEGNPRKGWVKVGLLVDLGQASSERVYVAAQQLRSTWSANWEAMPRSRNATDAIVEDIDGLRTEIQALLSSLE